MLSASLFSNTPFGTYALLFVGAAYVVSMLRDWRPIKALREENREQRHQLGRLQESYDDLQRKYDELVKRYEQVEKSRNFEASFDQALRAIDQARSDASHEHEKIIASLEDLAHAVTVGHGEFVKGLSANTAVTAALAAGINAGTVDS